MSPHCPLCHLEDPRIGKWSLTWVLFYKTTLIHLRYISFMLHLYGLFHTWCEQHILVKILSSFRHQMTELLHLFRLQIQVWLILCLRHLKALVIQNGVYVVWAQPFIPYFFSVLQYCQASLLSLLSNMRLLHSCMSLLIFPDKSVHIADWHSKFVWESVACLVL